MDVDEEIIRVHLPFMESRSRLCCTEIRQPQFSGSSGDLSVKSGQMLPFWVKNTHVWVDSHARGSLFFLKSWHDNYRPIRGAGVIRSVYLSKAASPAVSLLRISRLSASRIGMQNTHYGACINSDTARQTESGG